MSELYASIGEKDIVVKDCEKRLLRSLREKEQERELLAKSVQALEAEKREWLGRIEVMERMGEDKQAEIGKVKQSLELKRAIIEDLQKQLKKGKEDEDREQRTLSGTMSDLKGQVAVLKEGESRLREQKALAERMLMEKIENIKLLEVDMQKKDE